MQYVCRFQWCSVVHVQMWSCGNQVSRHQRTIPRHSQSCCATQRRLVETHRLVQFRRSRHQRNSTQETCPARCYTYVSRLVPKSTPKNRFLPTPLLPQIPTALLLARCIHAIRNRQQRRAKKHGRQGDPDAWQHLIQHLRARTSRHPWSETTKVSLLELWPDCAFVLRIETYEKRGSTPRFRR